MQVGEDGGCDAEHDQERVPVAVKAAGLPRDHECGWRPRQEDDPEQGPDPRVERDLDLVAEEPPDRDGEAWAEQCCEPDETEPGRSLSRSRRSCNVLGSASRHWPGRSGTSRTSASSASALR